MLRFDYKSDFKAESLGSNIPYSKSDQSFISINKKGEEVEFKAKGRHDACVVPRAVPIVESMLALSLLDAYLKSKTNKI